MRIKGLLPRQVRFIGEYLIDLNGTKAAMRAGYGKSGAGVQAHKLLKNAKIQKAIADAHARQQKRLEISKDKWLNELAIVGFSDIKNYVRIDPDTGAIKARGFENMPADSSRALQVIEEDRTIKEVSESGKEKTESIVLNDKIKVRTHDKLRALELIGKHFVWLTDKVQSDVTLNARMTVADLRKSKAEMVEDPE